MRRADAAQPVDFDWDSIALELSTTSCIPFIHTRERSPLGPAIAAAAPYFGTGHCPVRVALGRDTSPPCDVTPPLRGRLGIRPGSRLAFRVAPDGSLSVQVMAAGSGSLFRLLAKPGEAPRSLEEMDSGVTHVVQERAKRGR